MQKSCKLSGDNVNDAFIVYPKAVYHV